MYCNLNLAFYTKNVFRHFIDVFKYVKICILSGMVAFNFSIFRFEFRFTFRVYSVWEILTFYRLRWKYLMNQEKKTRFSIVFFFVHIAWPVLDNSFPCGFFAYTILKIKSNFLGIWNECNNLSKCSNDESNHFSKNKHFSAKCILFHLVENPYMYLESRSKESHTTCNPNQISLRVKDLRWKSNQDYLIQLINVCTRYRA